MPIPLPSINQKSHLFVAVYKSHLLVELVEDEDERARKRKPRDRNRKGGRGAGSDEEVVRAHRGGGRGHVLLQVHPTSPLLAFPNFPLLSFPKVTLTELENLRRRSAPSHFFFCNAPFSSDTAVVGCHRAFRKEGMHSVRVSTVFSDSSCRSGPLHQFRSTCAPLMGSPVSPRAEMISDACWVLKGASLSVPVIIEPPSKKKIQQVLRTGALKHGGYFDEEEDEAMDVNDATEEVDDVAHARSGL